MDHLSDYYTALGRFITEFAQTETWLLIALTKQSEVAAPMSKALFAGVRVDAAKSFIKRAGEVRGLKISADLERAFAQLSDITTLRNDIVHYGPSFGKDWTPYVTDVIKAILGRVRTTLVTPDILTFATFDLNAITSVIIAD